MDVLETAWRSVTPTRRPCFVPETRDTLLPDESCDRLPPAADGQQGYNSGDGMHYGRYDPRRIVAASAAATPRPAETDDSPIAAAVVAVEEEGPSLGNGAIVGIAVASAAVVSFVAFALVFPH